MRFLPLLLLAVVARAEDAAVILRHGKVFVAPGRYVQAVAVSGNRIAAAGDDAAVMALKGSSTTVVDLKGRTVVPGFHDAHVHFMKGSLALAGVDLNGSTTTASVRQRVRDFLAREPKAEYVQGRGWDQTAFPDKALPSRADLDAVESSRPVVLTHVDGHMLWLNGAALRRAGLKRGAADPAGARVLRDAAGEPTGIVVKEASALLKGVEPEPGRAAMKAALKKGLALARSCGVTSVQGPLDVAPETQLAAWRELAGEGEMTLRYFAWLPLERPAEAARLKASGIAPARLSIGGLKGFVDGEIGDRSAALLAPYSDAPGALGRPNYEPKRLNELVAAGHRAGFQIVMHAIGDRGVRMALDACEASEKKAAAGSLPEHPCKVEHIEVVDAADLPRFAALRAVASMQPSHMTYDLEEQNYNPARLGPRVARAFAWRSMEDAGALLAFGTDWPVMPLEPRVALFAATTREHFDLKPAGGWIPEQRVSLESAVRHYTLDPARAIGRGDELGTIEPGRLADLVVLDGDVFSASPEDLLKVKTDMTIFDGKIVYERIGD